MHGPLNVKFERAIFRSNEICHYSLTFEVTTERWKHEQNVQTCKETFKENKNFSISVVAVADNASYKSIQFNS